MSISSSRCMRFAGCLSFLLFVLTVLLSFLPDVARTAVTVKPVHVQWEILSTSVPSKTATQPRPLSQVRHAVNNTWSR